MSQIRFGGILERYSMWECSFHIQMCVGAHSRTRLKSHLDSESDNKTQTQMLRLFLCHIFFFVCFFTFT